MLDNARATANSTITIEKNAEKCDAHQKAKVLLLGDKARCNALPILDVNNEDVSCSHGAAMGKIDDTQLFYLMSRGLDEKAAKMKIISGFLAPIFEKIPHQQLREEIIQKVTL